MKKLNLLMLIALVYTLFSCREELQYTENFTPPKPHQDGVAKNINFSGFNRETGVSFSEASLSINKVMNDKNGKSSLRDFDIDTTFIKKFTYQKTKNFGIVILRYIIDYSILRKVISKSFPA